MAEIIKWMQERTGDFFRELEAHEKGFANQLTEKHATLLANKEDQMTNQMKDWKDEFFKRHHERQYNRNRRRVEEISQIIETSREEIRTLEGNDMDDDAEDGAE